MGNFDAMKLAVESSMPNNTVLFDDKGLPSIMVRIPKFKISDVIAGGSETTHPAFIVNGVEKNEIFISKYQNVVIGDRAYSLAMQDPKTSVNFDQAKLFSENKGAGWHLMTNAEWAAIALWCKKNGFMPRGNNNYGADHSAGHERGIEVYAEGGKTARVATGSGPTNWAHDGSNAGIYDLNGNVNEWVGGLRLVDGEIQIIADNNAAVTGTNQTAASTLWKALAVDGSLVAPGSANTLKYDNPTKLVKALTTTGSSNVTFETLAAETGITVPMILKALALAPLDADHGGDRLYTNNVGEMVAFRGGSWNNTSHAGVFYLNLNNPRTITSSTIGFRSAFVG